MRSLSIFAAEAQITPRKRGEKRRDGSGSSLLAFGVLCASAVSLIFFSLNANAQTGVITGHVVNEEGAGMPGVTVYLVPVAADRRPSAQGGPQNRTATDEDGNFKFTELARRVYSVSTSPAKGYVQRPVPISERQDAGYYRVGDNVTITMIKGGVITGRVTNATGEAVIGLQVNAAMIRDAEGNPVRSPGGRPRFTDDRGVYRVYGLRPGTYVVFTQYRLFGPYPSPYDQDSPVYHPSSTRETAAEVTVTGGGETAGIDIRYRSEPGHVISGAVIDAGSSPSSTGINVILNSVAADAFVGSANAVRREDGTYRFSIQGVAEGDYEIFARRGGGNNEESFVSTPRRIVVKGADVGGIELKLLPLGSITGKFALQTSPSVCESNRKGAFEEALLILRYESKPAGAAKARNRYLMNGLTEKGEFAVYNLEAHHYFFAPRLPNENWYVKAIGGLASTPAGARGAAADVARNGIALKAGEKVSGVTVTIAEGAAGVSGKVAPAKAPAGDGSRLPARLRVHMVPAEAAAANDVLRYAEAFARSDGSFSLNNIAPGKYWLLARAIPDDEPSDAQPLPVALDAIERAKLRKEAEALKIEIELKPCQRVVDQVVNSRTF
ncbi:MAG TPA: carboxypeptidase-like regulatory domain-containing protein [Blastocatellia bacterium]|jgi:hypothetical protein